jgi:RecB family exonuclease
MLLDSASQRATLTCPGRTLEGEPIYPSIYFGEIARHFNRSPLVQAVPPPPREAGEFAREVARSWRQERIGEDHASQLLGEEIVRRARFEQRGIYRADVAAGSVVTENEWSPTELNALADCPFIFLARHRLRIRPLDVPDFEVSRIEVGSLAHDILREFYSEPVPPAVEQAEARMQEVITRQLASVDTDGKGPKSVIDPSLWRIRRPQLVRALLEYASFAVKDARDGYQTLLEYLDAPLPAATFGTIRLKGRPDHVGVRRIDGLLTGIRVDDFKYSVASRETGKQLQQSFQIPVYAHLAALALRADPAVPIEGRYILLRSPSSPVVHHAVDSVLLQNIGTRIETLVQKVREGRLHPDPADKSNCGTCDYRRLCRIHGD